MQLARFLNPVVLTLYCIQSRFFRIIRHFLNYDNSPLSIALNYDYGNLITNNLKTTKV